MLSGIATQLGQNFSILTGSAAGVCLTAAPGITSSRDRSMGTADTGG
jgi:hypothetical protein